jgi:cytoskeletal protein CcmA (bactofilin family)
VIVLGEDCEISGDLSLQGPVQLGGRFKGTLRVTGKLDLLPTARVQGTVITDTLDNAGHIRGDVLATAGCTLADTAKLQGRLFTRQLTVADGARQEGHISIGEDPQHLAGDLPASDDATRDLAPDPDHTFARSTSPSDTDEPATVAAALQRRSK